MSGLFISTVRHCYTQAQVDAIFAKAEAAAANHSVENWDAYMLGYVSALLGVEVRRPPVTVTQ